MNDEEILAGLAPAPVSGIDPDKFEGQRVKIEKINTVDKPSDYDENGNYVKGLGRIVKVLRVESAVLELDDFGKELRVIQDFSLKQLKNGQYVWSTSKKAKLPQLLAKAKVNNPLELKGKDIVLVKAVNIETGKSKLVFV